MWKEGVTFGKSNLKLSEKTKHRHTVACQEKVEGGSISRVRTYAIGAIIKKLLRHGSK